MILDIVTSCSSASMYSLLKICKNIFFFIEVLAPILLLISLTILITELVANPDDKKIPKKIRNSVLALGCIFLVPMSVNIFINMLDDTYTVTDCWNNADRNIITMEANYIDLYDNEDKKSIGLNPDRFENGNKRNEDNNTNSTGNNNFFSISSNNSKAFSDVMGCAVSNANQKTYYTVINNKCYDVNGKGRCGLGWCVRFVWYCFYTTGHKDLYNDGKYTGNPDYLADWGKRDHLIVSSNAGQAGDIFDLYEPQRKYYHGGFIEKRNQDGSYGTIERCGNNVCRRTRSAKSISMLIRPKY